jgi:hypothetical protein
MKMQASRIAPTAYVVAIIVVLSAILIAPIKTGAQDRLSFWDQQRKGANCPNKKVDSTYWKAAADLENSRLDWRIWGSEERGEDPEVYKNPHANLATSFRAWAL